MISYAKLLLFILIPLLLISCGKDDKNPEYSEDKPQNTLQQQQEKKTDGEKNSEYLKDSGENTNSYDETQQTQKNLSGDKNNSSFKTEKPVATVTPLEAGDYNGKTIIVKGFVADVYQSEKVAYLNFVKKFPDNPFTAVIFARQFDDFPDINKYRGKDVEVTGRVSIYKGKPQIILNSPSQLKVQ